MRVFTRLEDLPAFRNAVVTIGSFDGVHCGHQQLLARINRQARRMDGESVVITFHPHPRQVIYPKDDSLQLLNTIEEKIALFERFAVDNVVVVPFTVAFSQQSADEYIEKFLVKRFHPHTVIIGYDHRFGLNRQGDIDYLRYHGERFGFRVEEIAPHEVDNLTVSSTKIRKALGKGDVQEAAKWLGYHYQLTGTVVPGQQLGSQLGFPTANIRPGERHKLVPGDGIYAVRARWQEQELQGMLYIGQRPSIEAVNERVIELNIFDFQADIYREELTIRFVDYIRGDLQFASLAELKAQLARDEQAVRTRLAEAVHELVASPPTPTLAIVILNYNGREYLEQFLPKVLETTAAPGLSVVIADNASTDDSLSWLATHYPQLTVLQLDQNLGFAGGYNAALAQVDTDYYVLLNSDIEVAPGWWEPCLEALLADPQLAAVQPKIRAYHQRDHFEYAGGAGGWLDYYGYPFCRGRIFSSTEEDEGQYDSPQEIFWASGAALFIRATLFHQLGGFDADYFAHAEEIDLCWRLKRAGYKIMAIPKACVFHVGGGTLHYQSVRKTFLNFRNTLITSYKNEPKRKLAWWIPVRLLLDGLAGALFLSQGKFSHILAIVRAHWQFFLRLGYWRSRRHFYRELVERFRIGPSRVSVATYKGSVIWAYYGRQKRRFKDLFPTKD